MRIKIVASIALGLSILFLAFAFSTPAERTQTYAHGLVFDHHAEIENNALTPPPTMSADTYFENITENIVVSLRYVPPPPNSPKMKWIKLPENDFRISVILKGRGWEKTIENSKVPPGSWKRKFNIRSLYRRAETIDSSLGLSPNRDHTLTIKASLEPIISSELGTTTDRIEHSLRMEMGSETISVKGPLEKTKPTKLSEPNRIGPVKVSTVRYLSIGAVAGSIVALVALFVVPPEERSVEDEYSDFAVASEETPEAERTVELDSLEELEKVAKLVGSPMVVSGEKVVVLDGDIAYIWSREG